MIVNCIKCGKKIPKVRLKALPDTKHCVRCVDEKESIGIMVWDGTATRLEIVSSEEAEEYWKYEKVEEKFTKRKRQDYF